MKKVLFLGIMCLLASNSVAATVARGRVSMADQMMATPRATVSKAQISAMAAANAVNTSGGMTASLAVTPEYMVPAIDADPRKAERDACVANNIGIGNTFVWASRYSNLNDYSSMVEDMENPDNNVCFVKVSLKSDDDRIDLSDISGKYFQVGQNIVCGSWVDRADMEKRILDAKKTARVLGTVGAVVGGAGIGVGAMELFGNELIGGKVEGQKSMSDTAFWRSKILELKETDKAEYTKIINTLKDFKAICERVKYDTTTEMLISQKCNEFDDLFDLAK